MRTAPLSWYALSVPYSLMGIPIPAISIPFLQSGFYPHPFSTIGRECMAVPLNAVCTFLCSFHSATLSCLAPMGVHPLFPTLCSSCFRALSFVCPAIEYWSASSSILQPSPCHWLQWRQINAIAKAPPPWLPGWWYTSLPSYGNSQRS